MRIKVSTLKVSNIAPKDVAHFQRVIFFVIIRRVSFAAAHFTLRCYYLSLSVISVIRFLLLAVTFCENESFLTHVAVYRL